MIEKLERKYGSSMTKKSPYDLGSEVSSPKKLLN
jgi:hypothetical protein